MRNGFSIWRLVAALMIVGGSATQLWAHPGHSHFSEGLQHAFTSGYHLVGLASIGTLLLATGYFLRKNKWGLRLQKAGLTSLCLAAALWVARLA